jgi:hypothetical protein
VYVPIAKGDGPPLLIALAWSARTGGAVCTGLLDEISSMVRVAEQFSCSYTLRTPEAGGRSVPGSEMNLHNFGRSSIAGLLGVS